MYWYGKFYYLEHMCNVPPEPDPVDIFFPGKGIFASLHRKFRRLCVLNAGNIGARLTFPSSLAMSHETLRHLQQTPYMIHPYSIFRKFWEDLMIIVYFFSIFIIPYDCAFINGPARYEISIYRLAVFLLSALCAVDIVMNFTTGYFNPQTKNVEMQFKKVALNYFKFFFLIDTLSTLPFLFFDHFYKEKINFDILSVCIKKNKWSVGCAWETILLLGCLKKFRFSTLLLYFQHHVARIVRQHFYTFNIVKLILVSCYCIFCLTLLLYIFYKAFIFDIERLYEFDEYTQLSKFYYLYYHITYAFLVYNFTIESYLNTDVLLVTTIINVFGYVLQAYLLAQVFMTVKSANSLKFHQTQVQLKKFMKHIQLSKDIQSRILNYHEFRMQGVYFKENEIVNIIGVKLKNDIILNSCQSFIESVHFFSNLPAYIIMRIVNYLHAEVFMANDVIVKPTNTNQIRNTTMYFIKTGTVAIYDKNNVEVTHLTDGSYFGEMSLILDDDNRYSKIIALESCNLFTLNRVDFLRALKPYPENLNKIMIALRKRKSKITQIAIERNNYRATVESTRKLGNDADSLNS